jgi:putative transposase
VTSKRSLARAISDAGFGQLVRTLAEKAERYGRVADEMPLSIRSWSCPCGAVHDRDHNAAKNILAAGRAERLNACGAGVSPPLGVAVGDEAGTTPDAA